MPEIIDNAARSRFEATIDGHRADLLYERDERRLVLLHTEVPEALGGHGIGGELVTAAVDEAARQGLTIVPICPYARSWLRKHPDIAGRATIEWPDE